jgi:chromosome segregation ATPase
LALGIKPSDQDSAARSLTALKTEMAEEKATWEKAQAENETLVLAVDDLKKLVDRFATQIPGLEEKIKHRDNMVLDGLTDLRAQELNLERTTKAKEDYKNQNAQLTIKLESKISFLCCLSPVSCSVQYSYYNC